MKPHLLYIAFWYPPSRASGVYRALATSRSFVDAGWDVSVVTASEEFFEDEVGSTDRSLLTQIPATVDVARVPHTFGLAANIDIRSLGWWSANFPQLIHRMGGLALRANEAYGIADDYVSWIVPAFEEGSHIHDRRSVDHILATGNPFSSFEVARLLAERLGVGFSIDFRDPWSIDVFTGRTEHSERTNLTAEQRIVEAASLCFHVNEPIADAYRALYPNQANKQVVVYNGYDSESIPDAPGDATPPFRFGVLGTVTGRWPMKPIIDGWRQARTKLPVGSEMILAGHLGYFARGSEMLEADLPDSSLGFRYVGPVAKADVAEFYDSLDVVILPVPGGAMVTSGKAYEANALGRPVVCVQSSQGGARRLLLDNPLVIGVDPEPSAIANALLKAAEMAAAPDVVTIESVRKAAARFERTRAIASMVEAVEQDLAGSRR